MVREQLLSRNGHSVVYIPFLISAGFHSSNRADLPSDYAGSLSSELASPISTGSSGGIDDLLSRNATSNSSSRPRRQDTEGGVAFAVPQGEERDVSSGRNREEEEEQAYSSGGVNKHLIYQPKCILNDFTDIKSHFADLMGY